MVTSFLVLPMIPCQTHNTGSGLPASNRLVAPQGCDVQFSLRP